MRSRARPRHRRRTRRSPPAGPSSRPAELEVAAFVDTEQLVGVAVLLVVVDQAGIRRRGDDAVEAALEVDRARVAMEHRREQGVVPDGRESLDPRKRVEDVAQQEPARLIDRTAIARCLKPVRVSCGARGN